MKKDQIFLVLFYETRLRLRYTIIMLFSDKNWRAVGIVEANVDEVFAALSRYYREHALPKFQSTAAQDPRDDHFVIDSQTHTITIHGDWWYHGIISAKDIGNDATEVTYTVTNIAKTQRILAFIAHRNTPAETKQSLQETLTVIGKELHARAYLTN